jgi:hypothetical protein
MNNKLIVIGNILLFLVVAFSGCNEVSNTINPITNRFVGDWDGGAIDINMNSDGTVNYRDAKNKRSTSGT